MNISPLTGIIESMRKQALPWSTILAELVDNAFDANANQVRIDFSSEQLMVQDDGKGCEDLGLFLQMGKRRQIATTRLGRYGIGAKDAIISAGDSVEVVSVNKGKRRKVLCNWKRLEKIGSWDIEDPSEFPSTDPSGTTICITSLRSDRLKRPEDVIKKLSLHYTPAIREGKQILFKASAKSKTVTIPEFRNPPLEHIIQSDLSVGSRKARIMVGLVPDGQVCEMSGLVVAYGFRVIDPESRIGLGDEPTPGLFGWLDLLEGWELTKNKDKIIDLTDLAPVINDACKAVIELARKRYQSVAFMNISKRVNAALAEIFHTSNGRKEKRTKPPESQVGTVQPKDTPRRRRKATNTQPGISIDGPVNTSKGLKVAFQHMGVDGPAWKCQDNIIYLNIGIPAIEQNDEKIITYHAVHAASAYMVLRDKTSKFPFMHDDNADFQNIAAASGYLLSRIASLAEVKISCAG